MVAGALLTTGAAHAASTVTPNACDNNLEPGRYRGIDLTWTGVTTGDAGGDQTVTVSGLSVEALLPDFLPLTGYNTGLAGITTGENAIPVTAHLALSAGNTVEATQVLVVDVTATFTITDEDGNPGNGNESSTPVRVHVDVPDVTWTKADPAQPVTVAQAGPGTLPAVDGAGPRGGSVTPDGSAFFLASLDGLQMIFDCQPGSWSAESHTTFTPTTAAPFVGGGAAPAQQPSPPAAPSTPTPGTPSTGASTDDLANTGSTSALVATVIGIVVLDVGYLLWSAARPARRRRLGPTAAP